MMTTLYRMETTPQQQQQAPQQQASGSLPMQRPAAPQEQQPQQAGMANFAQPYQQGKPDTVPTADELKAQFMEEGNKRAESFGSSRMTGLMQDRIGGFVENLREQMEAGSMTQEEAKQVLNKAIQTEFKSVQGWMDGTPEPTNWRETENPEKTKKYILQNKQAFEELETTRKEIEATKAKLEAVEDKKNPKYQKAMGLLQAKAQKFQQMEETLRQGLYGGEMVEAGLEMHKARGEDVL